MNRARLTEAGGGTILIAFGVAFAIGAGQYDIGNFKDMGPGMYPLIVGLAIAGLGVMILVMGLAGPRDDEAPFDQRTFSRQMSVLALVGTSLLIFGLLIHGFGMFPAIIGLVLLVGLTERERRPLTSVVTAIGLALLAWLIFSRGLGLNIPAFRWMP